MLLQPVERAVGSVLPTAAPFRRAAVLLVLAASTACSGPAQAPARRLEPPQPVARSHSAASTVLIATATAAPTARPVVNDSPFQVAVKVKIGQAGWHAFALDQAVVVVPRFRLEQDRQSAWVVGQSGVSTDRQLVQGLPGGGITRMSGAWPQAVQAEIDINPGGHACWMKVERRAKRWREVAGAIPCGETLTTSWWNPSHGTPAPFAVPWSRGRTLYEKYDLDADSSTFVLDKTGTIKARLQRARCQGGTSTRLSGAFLGIVLPGGRLIGIGSDCQTGIVSSESWGSGARHSTIAELPGSPKSAIPAAFFSRAAFLVSDGAGGLYAAVGALSADGYSMRPYVAHFDGQQWTNLECPATGGVDRFLVLQDGSAWLVTGQGEGSRLWRSAVTEGGGRGWSDETPPKLPPTTSLSHSEALQVSPQQQLWLLGRNSVFERRGDGWKAHPLPRVEPTAPSSPRFNPDTILWASWGEPMVAAQGEGHFVLLRWTNP